MPDRPALGVLTHGSLGQGVQMKLDARRSVETLRAGTFVVVEGEQFDFFSLITDLEIAAANENILLHPPAPEATLLREVLRGAATYATVSLKPMLMLPRGLGDEEPQPVKTVPAHFAPVGEATADDVARVFASEAQDPQRYFEIGAPVGMDETPVCLDLQRFVERSNAVFGKTGTGKSFLTRLLLCGAIRTGKAVNLVFDMHNEYGFTAMQETADGQGTQTKGLKQLFPSKVHVFSLDPASTRRRGKQPDVEVHLYADQIEPEDILPLSDTLNLTATATESTFQLKKHYKDRWLVTLLDASAEEIESIAEVTGAHAGSLLALKRKLDRLSGLPFFRMEPRGNRIDILDQLLESIDGGKSVVFEFGKFNSLLIYLLVANVLTRRLRDRYERKYEDYERTGNEADKPTQLLITIEEAHKFLGPATARETPFGKIAREMRKFSVSLLIVDQRPSGIDEEVLSQIGTKIVAQLSDEKDIAAALVGTPGAGALRKILATLDSKQQVLGFGHAFRMPIQLTTRTYGPDFFAAMREPLATDASGDGAAVRYEDTQAQTDDLFGF
ncbi:MAG: DUF87 domain-containing protein [Bacteroidota bacterium]